MSDVVEIYDRLADEYLPSMYERNSWTRYVDEQEKKTVLYLFNLPDDRSKQQTILDVGMGPGRWSKFFINLNLKKVVGVDISSKMVKLARKNIPNRNFYPILADMKKLPFKNSSFDKVFCFRAFKYSSEPDLVINEISRVVHSEGMFILEVSNKSLLNISLRFMSRLIVMLFSPPLESRWRYFQRAFFYSNEDIKKMLKRNGLKAVKVKPLFVLPSIPLLTLGNLLTPFLIKLDALLLNVLPSSLFCRSWVFLAKKENVG